LLQPLSLDLLATPSWKRIKELTRLEIALVRNHRSDSAVAMEDEEEAAKRARLSADNNSAMGDIDPRTRPAVPGSSCEYCVEKVRLESEMVKSRVKA
ncbi:hypothetical protein AVEN_27164-1, partial [Araneus ventricosus]